MIEKPGKSTGCQRTTFCEGVNHGCGWNIYGKDGELYHFKYGKESDEIDNYLDFRVTREECLRMCKKWLKEKYSSREWAYRNIVPKILIEESLKQKDGAFLIDYRCHTFNGIVKAIEIDSPMFKNDEGMIVEPNGKHYKLTHYKYKMPDMPFDFPDNFREIVLSAERLGKGLDYIRVDLYNTTKGIALGEMTIYPYGGGLNIPTGCPVFDKWLGDQWVLPESVHGITSRITNEGRRHKIPPSFPSIDVKSIASCRSRIARENAR